MSDRGLFFDLNIKKFEKSSFIAFHLCFNLSTKFYFIFLLFPLNFWRVTIFYKHVERKNKQPKKHRFLADRMSIHQVEAVLRFFFSQKRQI